jgi:hypothetical protein
LLRSSGAGKIFQNPPKIVKIEKCKVLQHTWIFLIFILPPYC